MSCWAALLCYLLAAGLLNKANFKITNETRIYTQADKAKHTSLKIDALKLARRVEVCFISGPALLIYPGQDVAAEITILSSSSSLSSSPDNSLSNTALQTF